ncbi:MAG: hypothetical protein ACRECQ_01970 [Burkholderiaceae bacterium]
MNATAATSTRNNISLVRVDLLAICVLVIPWIAAWLLPAFAQPQTFHDYADQRTWFSVPHAADVLSNLPFFVIGVLGLQLTLHPSRVAAIDRRTVWPYASLFAGVLLTTFGSAWYHLEPNDATLVWDRLPMALAFAGLLAGTLADRAPQRAALFTLLFAIAGPGTVWYWHASGNLLPYLLMQAFFIVAALAATASIASRYALAHRLYWAAAVYALALLSERLDHSIYDLTNGLISGHTIKHLLASAAILIVYRMLRDRSEASNG